MAGGLPASHGQGVGMSLEAEPDRQDLDNWFVQEILPLEPMLMRFLRRSWSDEAEAADLRQETYIRVYEAARRKRPSPVRPFVFFIARNLVIDRLRRKSVVSIETMADGDWLHVPDNDPVPEQRVAVRQDLQRLEAALDTLPPRCRQVIILRRVHGYSQREVAQKMGIKEETVESQMVKGMRLIADAMARPLAPSASLRRLGIWKD
jgi:RNA polymerase sigma-70 factor (ECF subfamily)